MYLIERSQLVHAPIEQTFAYFSDPRNLPAITPPWLDFSVRCDVPPAGIFDGCELNYTIRWLRIPLRWTTRIRDVEHNVRFVDTQERGPYRRWWHEHRFLTVPEGTLMTDRIEYELPLGPLGALAHRLAVRHQLEAILDYRSRAIDRIFPACAPVLRPNGISAPHLESVAPCET
jgi:ligand-binding SRPBCC domain-containing protein